MKVNIETRRVAHPRPDNQNGFRDQILITIEDDIYGMQSRVLEAVLHELAGQGVQLSELELKKHS